MPVRHARADHDPAIAYRVTGQGLVGQTEAELDADLDAAEAAIERGEFLTSEQVWARFDEKRRAYLAQ